jgi:hypothetical protein
VATTELRTARAALVLAAALLGLPGMAAAQDPPSEQQLIERLRQIQSEVAGAPVAQPAPADAAPAGADLIPPQQIGADLGERLGVEVLGIEQVEAGGGPRYAVKVMNPPGNYNAAFMVTTLLVDAVSGEVLGEAEGTGAGPAPAPSDLESGLEARHRTWR